MIVAILMSVVELVSSFPRRDQTTVVPGAETWWLHFVTVIWSWSLLEPLRHLILRIGAGCASGAIELRDFKPLLDSISFKLIFSPILWVCLFVISVFFIGASTLLRHGVAAIRHQRLKRPGRRLFWFRSGWHIAIVGVGLILLLLDGGQSASRAPFILVFR